MRRFFQPLSSGSATGGSSQAGGSDSAQNANVSGEATQQSNVVSSFNPDEIVADPALRKPIEEYDKNVQDQVRRTYILNGPCQPKGLNFPRRQYGQRLRSFREEWYDTYDWLEYSESKDASYCFYCFLFKQSGKGDKYEAFTKVGFNNWKNAIEKVQISCWWC